MKRLSLWLIGAVALAMPLGRAVAQDAGRLNQLVSRIEARAEAMTADDKVPVSRGALFRGNLTDARHALEELALAGEPAIPGLTRLLGSRRAHLRANAAYGLGEVGGPKTVEPLVSVARDTNGAVRFHAALALGNTGSAAALPALNELASDREEAVRAVAIQVSGHLRDVLAAEAAETTDQKIAGLVKLCYSQPACSRLAAYGGAAVPPLIAALDDADRGNVSGAASALSRIGDARALEPLAAHFATSVQAGKPEMKFAQAIAEFRGREVWPYLKKLLEADLPTAQYYALERIGNFDHPERLETLRGFLTAQVAKNVHSTAPKGSEMQINPVAVTCEILARIGDKSFNEILAKIVAEAPSAEKSIVKPLAQKALDAIKQRG
ncbi:MAG: HEAT repeat domain-containing protein [Armatimonadetes bacterium]|nr:HEAT repeat domain-containing protein [Armatimonadota bacterium]